MSSPVIIKGNKWGITLIIREEASIDSIISILRAKLHNTKSYYKNIRPISITFEGKKLTEDETDAILCTLREIGLNIKPTQTTKYTIKSYIPIMGGYLSEGMDLILASSLLIKNSLGLVGVMLLITTILSPSLIPASIILVP